MFGNPVSDGVFAINKPKSISSAQLLRDLQRVFNPSKYFASWLASEGAKRAQESYSERRKRRKKRVEVKLGHGGTLDPMATGVLIIGVGAGTKCLQTFLDCKKTYEATVLFGAATDSYDTLGKVLSKAPYAHITKDKVEKALERFRGKILQRPPLYSALHVQGKRLYEYAREGKEVPVEIQERPVEVLELSIIEWLEGGTHHYKWPSQEAETDDKKLAEKVLHLQNIPGSVDGSRGQETLSQDSSKKRKRPDEEDSLVSLAVPGRKLRDTNEELYMSGGLQSPERRRSTDHALGDSEVSSQQPVHRRPLSTDQGPPAVKLRMTVTSGFYVRSLAHDMGKSVDSLGCMCDLVRSRQERFELDRNVMDWSDIERGEEVWASKLETSMKEWHGRSQPPGQGAAPSSLFSGDD